VILADTSVLLDVVTDDPIWGARSQYALDTMSANEDVFINDIVWAELSTRFAAIDDVEAVLAAVPLLHRPIPKAALFLAAKAHQLYRKRGGIKTGVLPDFFIGAHAAVEGASLLTRGPAHVARYFPTVPLVSP
jgi:predicted nucleic acid-binding protein